MHVVFADTLSVPAANCLLKTLEEPPRGTIIMLLAQSVSDLLPTMVSRCQRISFNLVRPEAISEWLQRVHGATPEQATAATRRSGGRIGYALGLLGQESCQSRLLAAADLPEALAEAERAAALPLDQQLQLLEDLTLLARDTMVLIQTGREDWVGQPEAARSLLATGRPAASWCRVLRVLEGARQRLQAGASAKLAWSVTATETVQTRSH